MSPVVGCMMPPTNLSSVDLPEPLWPSRPSVSPSSMSNEMSRSAQKSSIFRRPGWITRSLTERGFPLFSRNRFETESMLTATDATQISSANAPRGGRRPWIATTTSTDAATSTMSTLRRYHHCDSSGRIAWRVPSDCTVAVDLAVDAALEAQHDRRHRVEQRDPAVRAELPGDELVRVDDRRHPEPREQHELEQVADVAGVDADRAEQHAERRREHSRVTSAGHDQPHVAPWQRVPHDRDRGEAARGTAGRSGPARRPTDASGRISRGNQTFFTSDPLSMIDPVAGGSEPDEEVPHEQAREQEDRERRDAAAQEHLEDEVEDDEVQQRVQQATRRTRGRCPCTGPSARGGRARPAARGSARCRGSARRRGGAGRLRAVRGRRT